VKYLAPGRRGHDSVNGQAQRSAAPHRGISVGNYINQWDPRVGPCYGGWRA